MKRIKYQYMSDEINRGTEEAPDMEQVFLYKEIQCSDENFEANYATALEEAYNGEITVEEVPDPETEPTTDEILKTMLGVN